MADTTTTYTTREKDRAEVAVQRSASRDEIVHIDYTDGLAALLRLWCEDWTDAGDVVEFWASAEEDARQHDFAGGSWRVHLDRREAE